MTVTTTESNNTWTADGNTNEFSFTFPILDESNLLVKKRTNSGLSVNMVLGIDYTVTGVGNLPERTNYKSGKIAFLQNIPAGSKIFITRNIPKTQEIDYVENTGLPAQGHEEALDKITMALQELNTESKHAVTLAPDVKNINPEISNIKPDDLLKIAPDGSGIIGIEIDDLSYDTGAINSISQDNSPTLSNTLNTNSHDIRFESEHGLVNSADNPILTVKYDDQNTSHLEIDTTKGHQQPIIRATSDNENTDLMLEAKGNGSISTLNNISALQGISVTGPIQAVDNGKDDADLVLKSKGSGNVIINGVPIINEINTVENTVTNLENKATNTEINITEAKESIATTSTEVNDLENKVTAIENNIPDMENNITAALNNVNAIENNVTAALNEINDLENNITTIDNNVKTSDKKINTTNDTVNIIKNLVATSSTKINELENTINTLENNVTNSLINKTDNMESKLTNINADIEYIENNIINDKYNNLLPSFRFIMEQRDRGLANKLIKSESNSKIRYDIDYDYIYLSYFIIRARDDEPNTSYIPEIDLFWGIDANNADSTDVNYLFTFHQPVPELLKLQTFKESQKRPIVDLGYRNYIAIYSRYKRTLDLLMDYENNDDIEIFTSYSSHPEKTLQFKRLSRITTTGIEYKCLGVYMPGEDYKWHAMIHIYVKNINLYFP